MIGRHRIEYILYLCAGFVAASFSVAFAQNDMFGANIVTLEPGALYDFDTDAPSDRSTADLRLVGGPRETALFLEPLNGAVIGLPEKNDSPFADCAASLGELKASRINANDLSEGDYICLLTSEDNPGVIQLISAPDKIGGSIEFRYRLWENGAQPPADAQRPAVSSAQSTSRRLTFSVPVSFSNVMPNVAGFSVRCATLYPLTPPQPGTWGAFEGNSPQVPLKSSARRNHNAEITVAIDHPATFDLASITQYTCMIQLQSVSGQTSSPIPETPRDWGENERWKVNNGVDESGPTPWSVARVIDASSIFETQGGRIDVAPLIFAGMAPIAGIAPGVRDDNETVRPDAAVVAKENIIEVSCPDPNDIVYDDQFREGRNNAGWHTLRKTGGLDDEQIFTEVSETVVLVDALLQNSDKTLTCRYANLVRVDYQVKKFVESFNGAVGYEGFGLTLSKTPGATCTPNNPDEWNDSGVCVGERTIPLCEGIEFPLSNGRCYQVQGIASRCAVTCAVDPLRD